MSEFNIDDLDEVIASADSSLVQMLALQLKKQIGISKASDQQLAAVVAENAVLVEALEKVQNTAAQQGNIASALLDEVTQLRRYADDKAPELRQQLNEAYARIAELEDAEQKLCAANVTLDARAEHAERRLVELERAASEPVAWTDEAELRDVEKDGLGYLFTVNPITPNADPRRVIKLYTVSPAPESRTVTVKLRDINEYLAEVHDKTLRRALRLTAEGVRAGDIAAMTAAGIQVIEGEQKNG